MNVALIILGVVIILGSFAYLITSNIDRPAWQTFCGTVVGILVGFVTIAFGSAGLIKADRANCEESGGKYVVDHYATTYVMSGKVLVPIESPIYKCERPQP